MATSTTDLILRFKGDPRNLKDALAQVRKDLAQAGQAHVSVTKETNKKIAADGKSLTKALEKEEKDRLRAAQSLQRQRSAALIAEWKRETREREQESRRLVRAEESLQKQRSAALIAIWRAEERERIRIARETERAMRQGGGSSGFVAGAVGGLTALVGLNIANEIRQAGAAWLDYSSKLETTRIAFTVMLGSAQAAEEHLKELQAFALKTPFQFLELIDASQRMQALGFSAQQVVPILTDVGNAVAAAGGGSERLDRVVLALSQMQSKGRVATQEMNQLAEAGIPGWRILEQQLGKSRAELVKMVEQGQVSSKVFLDAFQKFSQANFGGLMEKQSQTFSGAMSNIKDALLATSATAFEPLFKKISEITTKISEELQKGQPTLESITRSITGALVEIIATAGAQAGAAFVEQTVRNIGDPSAWKRLLANVSGFTLGKSFFSGLFSIDPEDLFGLGDVEGPAPIKIPDLKVPLQTLREQQGEVSETTKKITDLISDLSIKLAFYGQTTEKASVQQQLFKIGMEALTSAEGRRAIQLAELIDKQRISNELTQQQEKLTKDLAALTEGKYKNAFNSLLDAVDNARIGVLELETAWRGGLTPLERFQFGLKAQIEGMLSLGNTSGFTAEQIILLRSALIDAEQAMRRLTDAEETRRDRLKRDEALQKVFDFQKQQTETLRQLRSGAKTALQEAEEFVKLIVSLSPHLTAAEKASESFWLKFRAHIIDSTRRMERMLELMRETANAVPAPGGRVPENQTVPIDLGPPPGISIWQEAMSALRAQMVDFSEFVHSTFIGSIFDISDALAQGVATWALYGGSFAKAMKQALAALGAKIAAEATMQAAIHAAYAIGSAAFGNWAAAAQHALAAAKFAAIGGIAALATRALAGNDFNQAGGGASGGASRAGGGTGTSGGAAQRGQPTPVDLNRDSFVRVPPVINITISGEAAAAFDYKVERAVVQNINLNGEIRGMIKKEAA